VGVKAIFKPAEPHNPWDKDFIAESLCGQSNSTMLAKQILHALVFVRVSVGLSKQKLNNCCSLLVGNFVVI